MEAVSTPLSTSTKLFEDEKYLRCIRCGLCSYTCPVYRELLVETEAPRGKVALIRGVGEGQLEPGENYARKIYHCLQCNACTEFCPSKVEIDELMDAARVNLAVRGLLPPALGQLGEIISTCCNISGDDNSHRLIWAENLERLPQGMKPIEQVEIVYFVGCVSSFFPMSYSIPQALVEVMEAADVSYALLGGEEWCCGYPLLISGQGDKAEAMIRHNVAQVQASGASRVVVSCPSCYHIWHHTYPQVVEDMGLEVLHDTELLAELIEEGRLKLKEFPETVTYHDPCDLGRKSGLYDPPRRVLQGIPGLRLVEMADNRQNARCCGGGGNLETVDTGLSEAIAARRVAQALDTGANYLVSACQQCKRTLTGAVRREKARLRVMDITELVARAMVN